MAARAEAVHIPQQEQSIPAWSGALRSVPAYWHLLSLDAPTVAVLWCFAFARAAGVRLHWLYPLALGAAAWIFYVADRLLDAHADMRQTSAVPRPVLRERHWFHARFRYALAAPLALASLFILWVIATATPWPVLRDDLLLGAVAALYFARVHLGASLGWRLLTQPHKEALVGTIFALAVAVPSLALADHPARLVSAIFAFAALCVLNCLMIENAENGKSPSADTRALLALTVLGLVAALLPSLSETRALLIATSLSAFLLTALTRESRRLSPLAFRVAADAVLLTPLLVLPWLRR